ncbi:hypothetical protein H310_01882 [Aphanomyces invadans]|uniref:Cystatin domain-containing protein n=1 Tax=Aphanomyces invadans TaxID=157072 RepID=A0A024UM20_9STRA|nr:hypothetical protein H310_01882 [Aphanomyces invadans]ETW07344.1 hypothetical protein H310_01882 [Aphanomyces invadans]|eukprot:XP_008863437.1 hypothetical protein H310_01882 [Aphanomyces invadans]
MKTFLRTIALSAALVLGLRGGGGQGDLSDGVPGGSTSADVEATKSLLYKALETATSSYVCVNRIVSVDQQVVAGMHYTFHVLACPVSSKQEMVESCATAHCSSEAAVSYSIDVIEKRWKDEVQLQSITKEAAVHEVSVGGWKEGSVTDATSDFYAAVQSESSYANANIPRICAIELISVNQQVVSGMNYQFHVNGCAVPTAAEANAACVCEDSAVHAYTIAIYAQSWTHTYKVTSVTENPPVLGGWTRRSIQETDKARFVQAMDADTNNPLHVCPLEFVSLESQVVAGTNYRYHVNACPVEEMTSSGARPLVAHGCPACTSAIARKYEVTIYKPLDAAPSLVSIIDVARMSLGLQSHRSAHQGASDLGLLAVLVSGVVVVSLLLVHKMRRSQYEKLKNMQVAD